MSRSLLASALLAVLAIAGLSAPALAADLPTTKGPAVYMPPPPPAWNWAGLYAGVSGGWGWGFAQQTDPGGFNSGGYHPRGGIAGATVGYNWQMGGLVTGLEGDGSWTSIHGSTAGSPFLCGGGATPICQSRLDALGTVRGRVGFTVDRFMPYLTGGAAIGDIHGHEGTVLSLPAGALGDGSRTIVGWTIGVGVEAKIAPQWSAKLEFLHVDLGNHTIFYDTIPLLGGAVLGEQVRFTTEIVRAGVNYQFDMLAPPGVAAKY